MSPKPEKSLRIIEERIASRGTAVMNLLLGLARENQEDLELSASIMTQGGNQTEHAMAAIDLAKRLMDERTGIKSLDALLAQAGIGMQTEGPEETEKIEAAKKKPRRGAKKRARAVDDPSKPERRGGRALKKKGKKEVNKAGRAMKIDVTAFANEHTDIQGELAQARQADDNSFVLADLVHYLRKPKDESFDSNNTDHAEAAVVALKRVAKLAGLELPRGGKGLSADLSLKVLAAVDAQANKPHPGDFAVLPAPPKKGS